MFQSSCFAKVANFSRKFSLFIVIAGTLIFANVAMAAQVIDFSETSGYGLATHRVMIENIRVDTEIYNPFDPTHPTIVSSNYNVPFSFDLSNYHLVPDLTGAVVVGGNNLCAGLNVYVNNAFNGDPISGALIMAGSSSTYTDSSGLAQFTGLAVGAAQLTASATGFVPSERQLSLTCDAVNSVGLAMSPSSGTGSIDNNELRVVLSWGENPSDLDSHLTGPDASNSGSATDESNRFHVYYGASATDVAVLDTDDTSSYGPETITVSPPSGSSSLRPGLYRYSVHHYSGSSDISNSNASVSLWVGSTLYRTYTPPAGSPGDNAVWTVFEIFIPSAGQATLYDINTFTANVYDSNVRSTSTGYGSVETGVDFTRLPSK